MKAELNTYLYLKFILASFWQLHKGYNWNSVCHLKIPRFLLVDITEVFEHELLQRLDIVLTETLLMSFFC